MIVLQVVAELHGRVGCVATFRAVVHLHSLVFASVKNVLPDVLGAVGSGGDREGDEGHEHLSMYPQKGLLYDYIFIVQQ